MSTPKAVTLSLSTHLSTVQHLVEQNPEREDIYAIRVRPPAQDLRSHVPVCTTSSNCHISIMELTQELNRLRRHGPSAEGELPSNTEIPEQWVPVFTEEDIVGLDVAMDDASLVNTIYGLNLRQRSMRKVFTLAKRSDIRGPPS